MRITFWGTRGSIPTPMINAEFRVKVKRLLMNARNIELSDENAVDAYLNQTAFPNAMTFGGNTPCVEIYDGDHQIILDCGSGLRQLGHQMIENGISPEHPINIFQTHTHWDHIMGFPFFAPAYVKEADIHIYGVHPNLRERFEQQMDRIHFPITIDDMRAHITFHQLKHEQDITIEPFTIKNKGLHHPGGAYSYRISNGKKSVVLATDGEYKEPNDETYSPYIEFFKNTDVLIFDAMYATLEQTVERENYGHSTAVIGIDISCKARINTLVLFHHDPECNDSQIAQSFFNAKLHLDSREKNAYECCPFNLITSYDGLVIDV